MSNQGNNYKGTMKKILILLLLLLFACAGSLFDKGGYASDEFISFGTPNKDFCTDKCEKYGILRYGQIDIEKPSVTINNRKYVEPWCFCMEICLQLDEPYCKEDSTNTNIK